MYRWNSRGYNNTSHTRNSNLSESTSSVISVKLWIWNVFKAFFSLLPILQCVVRKVNPINCLVSEQQSISCPRLFFSCNSNSTNTPSCDGSKSSLINNCNISGCNDSPQPRKMTQILSKTMTLLGIAFLIHFIIMSTFATEREGYAHGYSSEGYRRHPDYIHRSQRSYRNTNQISAHEENGVAPARFHNKSETFFLTENSTTVTAQIGSATYLPCAVRNLGSGVVSWIRRRDYTLLTVGMGTYSNDVRFWVEHNRAAQNWQLHVKNVQESDAGIYECQSSVYPSSSIFICLSVVEAKAEILGEPDKHVRSGSTFELVCVLRDSTEPPVYVFWFHNENMINYDVVRGVVVNSDSEKSILTIQDAKKTDSGSYRCVPSNAKPASISVHILNGEKPAAMQHGSRNDGQRPLGTSFGLLFVATVFVVTVWLNLNRNLCYLHREVDAAPPPLSDASAPPAGNLQLVHIPHEEESHPQITGKTFATSSLGLMRMVYDESDSADKVDMRLGAALRKEKFRLILSTSRVCILEISYHQNHTRNRRASSWKTRVLLANSTSNKKKAKNVADVAALSHVVVSTENRSNIINSASPSHHFLSTRRNSTITEENFPLDNFFPSLLSDFFSVPSTPPNAKLDTTTTFSSSSATSKLPFDKESLFKSPAESGVAAVGHNANALIWSR